MAATSRGIDVSSYQGPQDWKGLARAGVTFAFAKATEGQRTRDGRFADHITGIIAAGLVPGAYHYGWPTQDAHAEADNYLAAVAPHTGPGFVHVLDLERRTDGANYAGRTSGQIRAWAEAWIVRVRAAYPRARVIVYTSADDIKTGRMPTTADALWYPAYPAGALSYTQAEQRARPAPSGRAVLFWQFTSSPIDRSIAYMTPAALRAWAGATTPQKETPDMQASDQLSTQPWFETLWPKDAGLADGKISVRTALVSGYGQARRARELLETVAPQVATLTKTVAAQNATISALVAQLGKGADTKAIVTAVEKAIAAAVVHVSVDVTGASTDA